ncbi:hypothetical protein M388_03295 [Mesotoga sp. Brook.08.YT.4.2.5.4.]|nr:hypothetical protein M388_03295 [Mesotoga sp. Brook.08.YT.4.2.5.4.]
MERQSSIVREERPLAEVNWNTVILICCLALEGGRK